MKTNHLGLFNLRKCLKTALLSFEIFSRSFSLPSSAICSLAYRLRLKMKKLIENFTKSLKAIVFSHFLRTCPKTTSFIHKWILKSVSLPILAFRMADRKNRQYSKERWPIEAIGKMDMWELAKNHKAVFRPVLKKLISSVVLLQFFFPAIAVANLEPLNTNYLDYPPPDASSTAPDELPDNPSDQSFVDLEEMRQDFVLETRKINIPGYPDAFNPSITRWRGSLLMCFRIYDHKAGTTDKIGFVWLDDDFRQLGPPKLLRVLAPDPLSLSKRQDPRLIVIGDRLYMIYNNVLKGITDREIRRMFVTELRYDGQNFYSGIPTHLLRYDEANDKRSEKNWVPIVYEGTLLLGYSVVPHRILRPIMGTTECKTFATSRGSIKWKWGALRGGTPALLDGDKYLAFFHSSENMQTIHSGGRKVIHYFMGAYTFSAHPPFEITSISQEPIIGKNFYHGVPYKTWKPLHVVFPGGFVFNDNYVWVAYGRQDHEIWIAKLDKRALLRSMVPVKTVQ